MIHSEQSGHQIESMEYTSGFAVLIAVLWANPDDFAGPQAAVSVLEVSHCFVVVVSFLKSWALGYQAHGSLALGEAVKLQY